MMIADSERLDLASASSARRRRYCVGSENLIRELRAHNLLAEIPEDPDAASGNLVHAAWAGEEVKLNGNQQLTLEDLVLLERMVLVDWAGDESVHLIGREQRLWVHDGFDPVISGQYDVAYGKNSDKSVLILDAKTLYGEQDPAEYNDQLRELVALYYYNEPATERIRVGILAPKLRERCTIADYDRDEMKLAYRLMRLSLAEAAQPDAVRTPGNYCTRCPAKLNCEEARQLVGRTYSLAKRIEEGEYQIPLGEKGAAILENIKTAKDILKALEENYKARLALEPDAIPGWRLKEGKKMRVISEPQKAFSSAKKYWFSDEDFWACCDVVIGRLEEKLGIVARVKGQKLTSEFNAAFGELVTYKQYGPELEKIRRKKGEAPDAEPDDHRLADSE
jgi:Protein of unknown function (DUF2800)